MNIVLEGYNTNIENEEMILTVVRDNITKNIHFFRDGTVYFMDKFLDIISPIFVLFSFIVGQPAELRSITIKISIRGK